MLYHSLSLSLSFSLSLSLSLLFLSVFFLFSFLSLPLSPSVSSLSPLFLSLFLSLPLFSLSLSPSSLPLSLSMFDSTGDGQCLKIANVPLRTTPIGILFILHDSSLNFYRHFDYEQIKAMTLQTSLCLFKPRSTRQYEGELIHI